MLLWRHAALLAGYPQLARRGLAGRRPVSSTELLAHPALSLPVVHIAALSAGLGLSRDEGSTLLAWSASGTCPRRSTGRSPPSHDVFTLEKRPAFVRPDHVLARVVDHLCAAV